LENVYVALVADENIRFVQECMPVDGPEAVSEPIMIQSRAVVGIVHVVGIDRGETHEKDGAAAERPRALGGGESLVGTLWIAFDRKALFRVHPIPAEVARLGKGPHLAGSRGKLANPWAKPSVEELSERAIFDWLELVHVDVVLADKRLDFPRTPARVLVGGVEPVKEWLRFDPLRDGTLGLGLVSRRMIVHPLADELSTMAIPNG